MAGGVFDGGPLLLHSISVEAPFEGGVAGDLAKGLFAGAAHDFDTSLLGTSTLDGSQNAGRASKAPPPAAMSANFRFAVPFPSLHRTGNTGHRPHECSQHVVD